MKILYGRPGAQAALEYDAYVHNVDLSTSNILIVRAYYVRIMFILQKSSLLMW